jgi:SAM-dependent methyltransferase|tara:strand:+ start:1457 stop:2200 length:744 start_codon:yes stop_codon:yes gene_type:complete
MDSRPEDIGKDYFSRPAVIDHYLRATAAIGLWESEEFLLKRYFQNTDTLLEVGCGTGRIALGMHEIGFAHVIGIDLSRPMVKEARRAALQLDYGVSFQVADACALPFEDALYEGAIFGFNGLMQIPGREPRRAALGEIKRVVAKGGHLIFTAHDRSTSSFRDYWEAEAVRWEAGEQDARLAEFGDRIIECDEGDLFIHVPSFEEVKEDLAATGWTEVFTALRQDIANESEAVREFADECRFWVVQNS